MKKIIELVMTGRVAEKYGYKGSSPLVKKDFELDLDNLSPAARAIAENIHTTNRRDGLSLIWVKGPSIRELMMKDGLPSERIENAQKWYGEKIDEPTSIVWPFNSLRYNETPEDYFERQVREMKENGWTMISSSYLKSINFVL